MKLQELMGFFFGFCCALFMVALMGAERTSLFHLFFAVITYMAMRSTREE